MNPLKPSSTAFTPSAAAYEAVAPKVEAIIAKYNLATGLADDGKITMAESDLPLDTFKELSQGQMAITRNTLAIAPMVDLFKEQVEKAIGSMSLSAGTDVVDKVALRAITYTFSAKGEIQFERANVEGQFTSRQGKKNTYPIDVSPFQLTGWLVNARDRNGDGRFQIVTDVSTSGHFDSGVRIDVSNPHTLVTTAKSAANLSGGSDSISVGDIFNHVVANPR